MHHSASTTYSCSSKLRNSLQIARRPSNNTRPVTGSPGGGCGCGGGGEGEARLFCTMWSSSAMSFALLPCCFSSLLIVFRHSAASASNSVENIRLFRSNSRSSQSFFAIACRHVVGGCRPLNHLPRQPSAQLSSTLSRHSDTLPQIIDMHRHESNTCAGHGRSSFRDWAAECIGFPFEVAEMALAHAIGDKVEAVYRRGEASSGRRETTLQRRLP